MWFCINLKQGVKTLITLFLTNRSFQIIIFTFGLKKRIKNLHVKIE